MQILCARGPSFDDDDLPDLKTILSTPLKIPLSTARKSFVMPTSGSRSFADLTGDIHSHVDGDITASPIKQPDFINGGRTASNALDGAASAERRKRAAAVKTRRYTSDGAAGAESDVSDFQTSMQFGNHEQSEDLERFGNCLLYTSPSPRDRTRSRMPSSA